MRSNLRRFLSYYRPYKKIFWADLGCAVVSSAIALALPLGVRRITGELLTSGLPSALGDIYRTGLWLLLLALVGAACFYVVDYMGHYMGGMIERDFRSQVFEHLSKLSFSYYDEHKTGQLMSRISNDTVSLAEFYHHGPEDYAVSLIKFAGSLFFLFMINRMLSLWIAAFVVALVVITAVGNARMRKVLKRNKQHIADINAQVEDSLAGIRVVQSFTNERGEQQKFDLANETFLESRRQWYQAEAVVYGLVEMLVQMMPLAAAMLGGAMILKGQLSLPDLIGFIMYIGYLTQPVLKIMWMTEQFQDGWTSFERLTELLDIEPDIKDKPGAQTLLDVRGDVTFEDVSFRYQEQRQHVLQGISFKVPAGGYVAIVGSSGVGKTTLCSLIPRFYDVSEGRVTLDGADVRDIQLQSLRRHIGVVQQDVHLFAGSVAENIRYGRPDADDEQLIEAAKKANAHEFIAALPDGYNTDIGQRGVKLSGGQRQRISIARMFLKDPKVLILDEATSALDAQSELAVRGAISELSRGRTTFVIAHRLSTIRDAERILVLTENGIEEQGTHEQLLRQGGAYARLYKDANV